MSLFRSSRWIWNFRIVAIKKTKTVTIYRELLKLKWHVIQCECILSNFLQLLPFIGIPIFVFPLNTWLSEFKYNREILRYKVIEIVTFTLFESRLLLGAERLYESISSTRCGLDELFFDDDR